MACEHQRDKVIANLFVGQVLSVLTAGGEQQRHDVGAGVEIGLSTAGGDHRRQ
jgi:hypothetical protein